MIKGLKSTDAEIILDLEKGQAIFDYSLNKFSSTWESNTSCCLLEEGSKEARILNALYPYPQMLLNMFIGIPAFIYMIFANKIPKYQYGWQKFLKYRNDMYYGVGEESVIGKQDTKSIKFDLDNNIWFEYKLDGDYNSKIIRISLKRKLIKKEYLGITSHSQKGWSVIFEFKEPPQYGFVTLRYTL